MSIIRQITLFSFINNSIVQKQNVANMIARNYHNQHALINGIVRYKDVSKVFMKGNIIIRRVTDLISEHESQ